MPAVIIHKDGAYNVYSTVSDSPHWGRGLTLKELEQAIEEDLGEQGLRELPERLERAHSTGCSLRGWTLEECIRCNRVGPNSTPLPIPEFIKTYLTAPT